MKRKLAFITALLCMGTAFCNTADGRFIENLPVSAAASSRDRAVTAVNTGSGMLISWKYLSSDSQSASFNLYRNDQLICTSNENQATCFLDRDGNASSSYRVDTVVNGKVISSDKCGMISDTNYFQINLDVPKAQTSGVTYSPNDCTVGDADGDGINEIFVKWDPSNSKDNSQKGKTDKVFIDCYKFDGTKLWRIDLGINIRAGAHYTQMLVADFDNDGYAELTCKTADGTVDGVGKVIGNANADHRNSSGYILSGDEYYTLFDGRTGAALDTVKYNPQRGTVSSWGDKYGNRVDRFLGAVMYLDENHPSAVTVRGYYTRMTACAYDVVNKKLVQRWYFDSNDSGNSAAKGNGNHNCMPADVDGDGKQELVLGSTCIDDNGKILWCTKAGHGDALHVGDFLPERDGLEVWMCHEEKPYGTSLLDAKTGKVIFRKQGSSDTGRACADNVWAGNDGAEFWGLGNDVLDGNGNTLSMNRPAINFLCYWDGDLEREILDGYTDSPAKISKVGENGKISTLMTTDGYYTCNTTKGTPCLSADILGDWREEVMVRAADGKSLRIYCTTYETDYRITALMDDTQYRTQVAGQNVGYNQPPHASFYLGSDADIPSGGGGTVVDPPVVNEAAVIPEGAVFMIKNANSGLYMEVADASAANGANVQQWGADGSASHNTWRAVSAGDGYYYLYSQLGDKITYCLDVTAKKTDNGTNMEIYTYKDNDAQKFKFVKNDDGSYRIMPKVSGDKSCVEVINAETGSGANIQLWEANGHQCQNWILEKVTDSGCKMDTSRIYMFKNSQSSIYMDVTNGTQADGTNVQQWNASAPAAYNSWTLEDAGNGYYYILSRLGDGKTYYLDVADGKSAEGTNVQIWTENKTSSQLFKFVRNNDGTYTVLTKASKDNNCLAIDNAGSGNGANLIQSAVNLNASQKWILEEVGEIIPEETTTTEQTTEYIETTTAEQTTEYIETTNTEPENILLGDVTADGIIDVRDVTMLNQYIVKLNDLSEISMKNADVIADGRVDLKDLGQLKKYIIKVIDKF